MKRILLALAITTTAVASFISLDTVAARARQQARVEIGACQRLSRQLAAAQDERSALQAKLRESDFALATNRTKPLVDATLVPYLLTNRVASIPAEIQEKILAELWHGPRSSGDYLLVSKAALKSIVMHSLKPFPDTTRLSEAGLGILAITPEEEQRVESAFAKTYEKCATWAKANVHREGPSGEMLVRYSIPIDQEFEQASTDDLFARIATIIGDERGELLRGYFEWTRVSEDGAIGQKENVLEVYRGSGQSVLKQRSGWKWQESGSECAAINTDPDPIRLERFPLAFYFVFPGGWQELAQREGFELPENSASPNR